MDQKNEDSSKSVCSFDLEAIFPVREVETYPGMVSLCPSMRFRKIPLAGQVRACNHKNGRIFENSSAGAIFLLLGGPAGAQPWKGLTRRAFLSLTVLIICNKAAEEIFDFWTPPFRMTLFTCFSKHTVKPPRR